MSLDDDAPREAVTAAPAEDYVPTYTPFPEEARPDVEHLIIQDDTPVDNLFFEALMHLLVESLSSGWAGPGKGRPFLVCADVGIFPEPKQTPVVPDVFLSLDVRVRGDLSRKENNSYFVWMFGKPPEVVVEFVSDRRGGEDTHKKAAYARIGVAYYVIFDPWNLLRGGVLRAFELRGKTYHPIDAGLLPDVGLGLTFWEGEYKQQQARWLRWCDADGKLILTGKEQAEQEKKRAGREKKRAARQKTRAEQAERQARQEKKRAERLAAKLRSLGVDPTTLEGA